MENGGETPRKTVDSLVLERTKPSKRFPFFGGKHKNKQGRTKLSIEVAILMISPQQLGIRYIFMNYIILV